MVDFNIDTSSYPKSQSIDPLRTIGQIQGIQGQAIANQRNQLALMNERYKGVASYFGTLLGQDEISDKDIANRAQELVKSGIMTPQQYAEHVSSVPSEASIRRQNPNANPQQISQLIDKARRNWLTQQALKAEDNHNAMNWYLGSDPRLQNVGGGFQPVQNRLGKVQATGPTFPEGLPVTTPGYIPGENREAPIGAANPTSPGLPVAGSTAPIVPKRVQTVKPPLLPIGPNYDTINSPRDALGRPQNITGPQNPVIPGNPPFGSKAATEATGVASGRALANERDIATNYQRSVFPLEQAIHSLENLGTKGTGPGTETINQLKSFILSNVPGVTEANFDGTVADFDKAKKYLTDYVNQNGNSGTNDKLAAAFAGNPSVSISNAAAKDVAKSAYSLARVRKALLQEFENSGAPENQYSRWAAQNASRYDPRAFGVDMMNNEAKKKLRNELENNPTAKRKFETSLKAAVEYGLVR